MIDPLDSGDPLDPGDPGEIIHGGLSVESVEIKYLWKRVRELETALRDACDDMDVLISMLPQTLGRVETERNVRHYREALRGVEKPRKTMGQLLGEAWLENHLKKPSTFDAPEDVSYMIEGEI